jgi:hypothetical protein
MARTTPPRPADVAVVLPHCPPPPGWKVGGWPTWGLTDPRHPHCPEMTPLLTIASALVQ